MLTEGSLNQPNPQTFKYIKKKQKKQMAKDKIQMPVSTAGITRYFEDYKSKIEFKPGHVIILSIIVMLIVIILHIWGTKALGIG